MNLDFLKNKKIITLSIAVLVVILFSLLIKIASAPEDGINIFTKKKTEEEVVNTIKVEPQAEIEEKEKTLIFTGDIMLSRQVNSKMETFNDYAWPFLKIADFLNEADIVIANLESPFLKNAKSYRVDTGSFSFKANPLAVAGLNLANIKVISLANNHTINQGKQGIIDTIEVLEENNIKYTGAGLNEEEARKPAIIIDGEDTFAFLSYAYPNDYSLATESSHGLAGMDIEKMEADIEKLKQAENIDLIVVLMHAGTEYTLKPNWQQKEFAKAAIDAGADIVVGHHPHWPQTFEFYNNKPIIYSLGNFVFDQMWSTETRQGLMLKLSWQEGIKELSLIPTKIYNYGQVEILPEGKERSDILERIGADESGIIYKKDEN